MYRAVTLAVLRAGVDPEDSDAVAQTLAPVRLSISTDPNRPGIALGNDPVSDQIRTDDVSAAVSAVAAVPAVRNQLILLTRHIVGLGGMVGIVLAGQDIGTSVWRAAYPKVYLTAGLDERARRHAATFGTAADFATVVADIGRREQLDSNRTASPLIKAADATEIDTTGLSIDAVVHQLLALTATEALNGDADVGVPG